MRLRWAALLLAPFVGGFAPFARADLLPPPPVEEGSRPQWRVRVEVLMAALPQERFITLLPDLHDPQKIDGAYARILSGIAGREVLLTGYAFVQTLDRRAGQGGSILEKRFPTDFTALKGPQIFGSTTNVDPYAPLMPTAVETKPVGPSLEVTPTVSPTGDTIFLNAKVARNDVFATESWRVFVSRQLNPADIRQPQLSANQDTVQTTIKNGARVLVGIHPLLKPEGFVEVFLLQATATPTE